MRTTRAGLHAVVAIAALTPPVHAVIVYHPNANVQVPVGGAHIDVNDDGIVDLAPFTNFNIPGVASSFHQGLNGARIVANNFGFSVTAALSQDFPINSARLFDTIAALVSSDQSGYYGPWAPIGGPFTAYSGFAFTLGDGEHYGWSRIRIGATQRDEDFVFLDWAYETAPGATILTGAVPGPASALPFFAMAMGAASRRSRRA